MLMLGWGWVPRWEPLFADFVLLAEKLEKLGFTYHNGKVSIFEQVEGKKHV
jgi:hypothetical protein